MKVEFEHHRFSSGSLDVIDQANEIIEEYEAQGFSLTLRQLYYQFVARDLIPNTMRSYKRLGSIVNKGRLAGMIDWDAIEDRTRNLEELAHWRRPTDILRASADQYRLDKWENQPYRVEVWIEKEALVGVIEDVCEELDVPYFACRGYVSQSEQYRAGKRFYDYLTRDTQEIIVLHLGDHDPSGIDMTRDNLDRLSMFAYDEELEVRRIALNMDQVDEYGPPPNPAKLTDSRAGGYVDRFGYDSWELDALEPRVITDLIRDNVRSIRDDYKLRETLEREQEHRAQLQAINANWGKVVDFLNTLED